MQYQNFLQEVRTEQLREGRDGVRLVGEGLLVPDLDGAKWEAMVRKEAEFPAPWNDVQKP